MAGMATPSPMPMQALAAKSTCDFTSRVALQDAPYVRETAVQVWHAFTTNAMAELRSS
jgi:hypothetical protein